MKSDIRKLAFCGILFGILVGFFSFSEYGIYCKKKTRELISDIRVHYANNVLVTNYSNIYKKDHDDYINIGINHGDIYLKFNRCCCTSLVVQWLRLYASTAERTGSIHGQRTNKIPYAVQCSQKKPPKPKNQ